MTKLTRRFKKNKKNKTFKRGGSSEAFQKEERHGVFDIIGNKLSGVASSAANFAEDSGLKLIGLERIDKSKEDTTKTTDNINAIASNVENVIDKTGSALIENVNEVLESNAANETTKEAAEKTANIVKNAAEKFNEALDNPEVKTEVKESIEKAGEIGSIIVDAAEKPIEKAVDVAANAMSKATAASLAGVIKVGTDMMAAVPGVGAVIEVGKMLNDTSKAASAVVEAGSEAVEAASDAFIETKENVEKGLKSLEEKKRIGNEISSRTNNSIKDFENPVITSQSAGGRKTRRRLFKRKAKSNRVRFAI
jgi:ABC-type transporter Mla subunit MlaD